ncbi:MAG: hypothetical protein SGARI_006389, partial [Bacillariaceae sp.]
MNNKLDNNESMPMPMNDEEKALYLVFKWMDIDTVDLLLQTSKVCSSWKRASTTFLLENKASVYTDEGTIVTTRQEFLVEWKCEQRTYLTAHPPVPEQVRSSVRNLETRLSFMSRDGLIAVHDRYYSKDALQTCDSPAVLYSAGAPYIELDNQSSLKSHLCGNSGDTFSEDKYRYFLRISFGRLHPEWNGLISLKSAWRPSADGFSEGCILEEKHTKKLSKGSAIQLRFDITSVPWRRQGVRYYKRFHAAFGANRFEGRFSPFVGVIAVHKETREASVLCTGFSEINKK